MKILYVTRNDGTDMRVTKECNSLVKLGHEVIFVGWDRTPDKPKAIKLLPEARRRIFKREAGYGDYTIGGWPKYYLHLINCLLEERPDAVHTWNEYPAVMLLPFKGLLYKRLVVDVFDSVAAGHYPSLLMRSAAKVTRILANRAADRIIETSEELQAMLGRFVNKSIVIYNGPPDPGDELAFQFPTGAAVRLAIGGALSKHRDGLDTILRAIDRMPRGKVEVIASGWLRDEYAREVFVKHPGVKYSWLDSPKEFLVQAARCDAILYLRGDAGLSEYRSWVLPNRFFDAMSLGRPIIMGSKAKISRWVTDKDLGYVCHPQDDKTLAEIFHKLMEHRKDLPKFARRVREMFVKRYTWEKMEERLESLYNEME